MQNAEFRMMNLVESVSLRLGFAALIFSMLVVGAWAQRETPPAGGQPKPFVFPKQDNYTLPNGMRVTLVQYGSIPKVAMQAVVRAGSINEKPQQRWISDMLANMLNEGTTNRSA